MKLTDARPRDAIELPEGMYTLAAVTHHRAAALDWIVWELIPDEHTAGEVVMFALIEGQPYRVKIVVVDALPQEDEVTVDHMIYELRGQGEARAERSDMDGKRDFWIGSYRLYEREGLPLVFAEAHERVIRLTFDRMDEKLVSVFQ
jgi:hypothetical protein